MQQHGRIPITATHKNIQSGIFIRVTNDEYAEEYLHGEWLCSNIPNEDVLVNKRHKYVTLLPTGYARWLLNLKQWLLGSPYRVPDIKINYSYEYV